MPTKRYEILLPLRYNDGSKVEPEKFQQTRRELVKEFGALTFHLSPLQGVCTKGKRQFEDELIAVVIDVPDTLKNRKFLWRIRKR